MEPLLRRRETESVDRDQVVCYANQVRNDADQALSDPAWSDWLAASVLLGSCVILALTQLLAR